MSFRPSHIAIAIAALVPLAAGCGDDKRPVTTTISSSPATVAVVDSGPAATSGEAADPTASVTYADAEAAYTGRNYDEAAHLFAAYTRSNPDNAWGHYMYGLSSWKAGDPEQSIASFDEALRLDPRHRKSLLNSARVLLETGRPREALGRIERAMSLEPLSGWSAPGTSPRRPKPTRRRSRPTAPTARPRRASAGSPRTWRATAPRWTCRRS